MTASDLPDFTLGKTLTAEQVAFFDKHGCIRFRDVATDAEVDTLRSALDDLEQRFIAEDRTTVMGTPLRIGKKPDGSPFIQRYAFTSHYSPAFEQFVTSDRFEPVRALCGEDARLAQLEKDGVVVNHYINQPGSVWRRLGWHTDGLRDLFYLTLPEPMLNVGIYLDDCPKEKGGVRLIPGTHKQGLLAMMFRKFPYFLDNKPDPAEICLEASKGDLTIHDGRLWHRAAPSELEGEASRRRTMYMAYVDGPVRARTEDSPMALYHRFQKWAG